MKNLFVKTENYAAFTAAFGGVKKRGAREAGILLVAGEPGLGKSRAVEHWSSHSRANYLRANKDWTPRQFMNALASVIVVDANCNPDALFARIVQKFQALENPPLVIDECQFCLANDAAVLEKARDFSDLCLNEVVLVAGRGDTAKRIATRHPQLSSRIHSVVEFKPASLKDAAAMCGNLSDGVNIAPDAVAEIHRQSRGRMRLIVNAISKCEEIGIANGLTTINAKAIKDFTLCEEWQALLTNELGRKE